MSAERRRGHPFRLSSHILHGRAFSASVAAGLQKCAGASRDASATLLRSQELCTAKWPHLLAVHMVVGRVAALEKAEAAITDHDPEAVVDALFDNCFGQRQD